MKKLSLLVTILCLLYSGRGFAQSSETVLKYIDTYKDIAIAEEIRTGVPAAITLAQGIHETGAGTSDLVLSSNNHFGIKCKSGWTGPAVYHDDDAKGECFRKYSDPMESYRDHSDFLKNRPYYASLFQLDPTDYKSWAYGLKKAGYATNPRYPQILIKLIEDYHLQEYTLIALKGGNKNENDALYASSSDTIDNTSTAVAVPLVNRSVNYPSGVFRINETSVVFVTKGTSYLRIADENKLSLSRLFDFNDMRPADIAEKDELVFLQRKRKTGASEVHQLQQGETLRDVAQQEGIRLESLMELNFLKPGMEPAPGEKIYLREKAPAVPRLAIQTNTGTNSQRS
jgi:LysM repeat protein